MGTHRDLDYKHKWYERNKERILESRKRYHEEHRCAILQRHQEYYQQHKSEFADRTKAWIDANYESFSEWKRKYEQRRIRKHSRRLPELCEHRRILRRVMTGVQKNLKPEYLIGCGLQELKEHLEATAPSGFSWGDVREFEIDHIVPCASFNLRCSFHRKLCFHFTNIHVMRREDHLNKHYHLRRKHYVVQ